MSSVNINASDVLAHLNQLGYQNISPQQLKDFMKDLKKLIKHEKRQEQREETNKENVAPVKRRVTNESVVSIQIRDCCKRDGISQAATSSPKSNIPINQPVSQSIGSEKVSSSKSNKTKSGTMPSKKSNKTKVRTLSESETTTLSESTNTDSALIPKQDIACNTECKKATRVKFCGDLEITKPSYIICRNPVKTIKSDPVALYHKYEQEWRKFKLPGENMHKNLRWAIRERMCGQTPQSMSAAPSMETIATRRKSCRI